MGSRSEEVHLDELDWRLLAELQADARLSYAQLGRRVNLSPPAVAERVRRLERDGVITGYEAKVSAGRVGQPVSMFVQLRCQLGSCLLKTSAADDYPEVVEVHKLTGEHCTMLKVRAASLEHLEGLLERLGKHGAMSTSMVLSTQYEGRRVEPAPSDYPRATDSQGWRHTGSA
ncbi:Lrp/AsnC family transcriptional regulator [Streptomyces sp. NPDC051940]|uniref:Lrp/AsnC family transcriptional regulator n=1 Tax=Streptomyces sp. NPDC051940 TaxID=3155675 RepID=UPI003424D10A